MLHAIVPKPPPKPVSPLQLSDHLITLAEQADRAGYAAAARRLVDLACQVLDERPN